MRIELWLLAALAMVVVCIGWKSLRLEQALLDERHAHESTRMELVKAIDAGHRWQMVADEHRRAAEALKNNTEACLAREAQARVDAETRKSILIPATQRPRTKTEQQQVVDDATRKAVADRLNRGL